VPYILRVRRVLAILVVSTALVSGPHAAMACSCMQGTPDYYARNATAVFTGVVRSVGGIPLGLACSSMSPVAVTFDVETVYKGDVPRVMTVNTVVGGASCGYTFVAGRRYTVFPGSVDGRLDAGMCRGNVEGTIVPADYGLPQGHTPRS
jgi:hypothetical protein